MKTKWESYLHGKMPRGCQYCVNGSKVVLFVTGLCPRRCEFCPISDEKWQKDVVYANEWKTNKINDIIKESELIDAKGAGFTGGDPLVKMDRTVKLIKALKKRFGDSFHIHLYTSLDLVDDKKMKRLYRAGLDEIRFDFDIDDDKYWDRLEIALEFDWDIGVEVPVIPGKAEGLWKIIKFIDGKGVFLNLNELEIPDNSFHKMNGFKTKNSLSYAVKGSEELALRLIGYIKKKKMNVNVHYCTATLKDKYQLANRLRRRAKNVARWYDQIDSEGMLIRGAIYIIKPEFDYREKIKIIKKSDVGFLLSELDGVNVEYDPGKKRFLTSLAIVKKNLKRIKSIGLVPAKVIEYPTQDLLEIEIDFL